MPVQLPVTDDVVEAYLKCPHKAYLRLTGVTGQPSEYVALQRTLDDQYRADGRAAWLRRPPPRRRPTTRRVTSEAPTPRISSTETGARRPPTPGTTSACSKP